jgi:hypothetical protein
MNSSIPKDEAGCIRRNACNQLWEEELPSSLYTHQESSESREVHVAAPSSLDALNRPARYRERENMRRSWYAVHLRIKESNNRHGQMRHRLKER